MRRLALCILFAVAACAEADANANQPAEMQGWKTASGKSPTKAEFAAIVAACQDRAVPGTPERPLDACLGNLGFKRE